MGTGKLGGQNPGDPVTVAFPRPPGLSNQGWQVLQDHATGLAESLTPYDKGPLRDGWGLQPGSRSMKLTNRLPYADFVDKGTLSGKYVNPHGGMAARNYSQKIFDQLSSLAGQLMQQYPAATGGTNRADQEQQQYLGEQIGKEFEYGKFKPGQNLADLGQGFNQGTGQGDWGANISVNHPQVSGYLKGLTGPARQQAFTELLAGSHKYSK